ncbi:MAG: hypothetical protein WBB74_12440 [Gaiellaceae bacterium]
MDASAKRKIVAGAAAGLAVAGGGGAIAATQFSPKAESDAVISDAAKQLGVQPSALSDALKKALSDRVDASVAAGRLTKDQGDALKARIQSGAFPIFGGPRGGFEHFGLFRDLDTAASYLGQTGAKLQSELESGKTLAQVAKDQSKSVDGLVQALTDAAKKKLDNAVSAGRLTSTQEQSILSDLKARITDFVNGKLPARPDFERDHRFGGLPPGPGL